MANNVGAEGGEREEGNTNIFPTIEMNWVRSKCTYHVNDPLASGVLERNTRIIGILFVAAHACLMTAFDDNSIFKKGLVTCVCMCMYVALGPFALLRLTSSNDSLMNGQEGTGRPTWLRQTIRIGLQGGSSLAERDDSRERALCFHLNIKLGTSPRYNDSMVNLIRAINCHGTLSANYNSSKFSS